MYQPYIVSISFVYSVYVLLLAAPFSGILSQPSTRSFSIFQPVFMCVKSISSQLFPHGPLFC